MRTIISPTSCNVSTSNQISAAMSLDPEQCWIGGEFLSGRPLSLRSKGLLEPEVKLRVIPDPRKDRINPLGTLQYLKLSWSEQVRAVIVGLKGSKREAGASRGARSELWFHQSTTQSRVRIVFPAGIPELDPVNEDDLEAQGLDAESEIASPPNSFWAAAQGAVNPWEEDPVKYEPDLMVDLWELE